MHDPSAAFIACEACGRRFAWKPQLAGRRVTCKCGQTFIARAPAAVPAAVNAPADMPTAADTPPPAESPTSGASSPSAPPAAGASHPAGIPDEMLVKYGLAGRAGHTYQTEEADDEGTIYTNLIVPIILIGAGAALWLGQAIHAAQDPTQSVQRLVALVLLGLVLNIAMMLGGCFLSALMLNINFGALGRTVLKLAGIAVFAGAVGSLIIGLDQDAHSIRGMIVAWHAVILIYFFAFATLFALDLQESLLTVVIIGIMQAVAMLALWK